MRSALSVRIASLAVLCLLLSLIALALLPHTQAQNRSNPWTDSQTIQPAALYKELSDPKTAPTILFIGFPRLYTAGHIKGSQFHGQGGTADGLTQIKSWAASLPRTTNLVIYCGCCPMDHCPNIRPAFTVLRDMGFTKLRLLVLPTSFESDWANKGLPYQKGS